jgi:predicted metal-dependent hydrolase
MTEQLGLFDARAAQTADAASLPLLVRESRRARRLTLRVLPPCTLELVVPRGTRAAEVAAFVHAHRRWIERARREVAARWPTAHERLPMRIELCAIGRSWQVRYEHRPDRPARLRRLGDGLEVRTPDADRQGADELLRDWLRDEAHYHLTPWVLHEAERIGRRPTRVQVRLQRTRWGSCSSAGTLSLNAALLFLPAPVVRYLLVHELCHLISLNHSRRFWATVARYEPGYQALDRQLTAGWADIPLWAHPQARPR